MKIWNWLWVFISVTISIYLLKVEESWCFSSRMACDQSRQEMRALLREKEWKNKISDDKAGLGGAEKYRDSQTAGTWIAECEDREAKYLKTNLWASVSAENFNTFSFLLYKFCIQEPGSLNDQCSQEKSQDKLKARNAHIPLVGFKPARFTSFLLVNLRACGVNLCAVTLRPFVCNFNF